MVTLLGENGFFQGCVKVARAGRPRVRFAFLPWHGDQLSVLCGEAAALRGCAGPVVGLDDRLNDGMTDHVPVGEEVEMDAVDPLEYLTGLYQTRKATGRQVDLGDVPSYNFV